MRVLIVRTDRLGETLLTLPLGAALKQAASQNRVIWMVQPALRELIAGAPGVDEVLEWSGDSPVPWWTAAWRAARLWRALRCDAVIIANPVKAWHAAAWLAGIPRRIGWDRKWGRLLTDRVPDCKAAGGRHELEWNLELLAPLGADPAPARAFRLPVPRAAEAAVVARLRDAGLRDGELLIAVHPWTSNARKQWPVDRFAALVRRLAAAGRTRVALIGQGGTPPADWPEGTVNLMNRTTVTELASVLARSRVLVSCDSGPVHLAAAVGTPVVALFGTAEAGSRPERWRPWGSQHAILHEPLEQLPVEAVVAAVHRYT